MRCLILRALLLAPWPEIDLPIEGTVADVQEQQFHAATCILVLGLVPDDGG